MKMTRKTGIWKLGMIGIFCLIGLSAALAGVTPVTVAVTNIRDEAAGSANYGGTTYRGGSMLFTNCVLYADSSGTTRQDLTGCIVDVAAGTTTTNIDYTMNTADTNGLWSGAITIPDLTSWIIQVRVRDTNSSPTNAYIYPQKSFVSEQSMF